LVYASGEDGPAIGDCRLEPSNAFEHPTYRQILNRSMGSRSKVGAIGLGCTAIFFAALILLLRSPLDADRYRSTLATRIQEKTGKQVEIGHLTLSFFPLSIRMENFGMKNPPSFPPGYIVRAARVDAQLDARALLHRQLVINLLALDQVSVSLISDPDGPWNFSTPRENPADHSLALGEIAKVEIQRGQLVASNLLPSNAPGPVFLEAHDVSGKFEHVNVTAMIDRSSRSMGGQGFVTADRLSFGTVDAANLSFKLQVWAQQVFLAEIKARVSGGDATGAIFFDLTGKRPAFRTSAKFVAIDVAHLLEPFENGRGKMTGNMDGDLSLAGEIQHSRRPLAGIRGNGRVILHQGEVPNLQLNANVVKLVRFNNRGPAREKPSSFNRISTDFELADLRILSKTIDIDGYGVDVDGSGSLNVDGSNELNYEGVAKITTPQGFFTNTFARFAGAKLKDGMLSFPFHVGGTVDTPAFSRSGARP
jgi:uncharacterized protein involved in outer membrane biogenesis